jgi:rhodanese-related sulfurtransferase
LFGGSVRANLSLEDRHRRELEMRVFASLMVLLLAWPASAEVLSPDKAEARAEAGKLTIVDVRLPDEWAATGLPAGAVGVSLQNPRTMEPRPDFVASVLRALGGRQDAPVALICAGGARSAFAAKELEQAGFTQVYDISEGVSGGPNGPGWLQCHLPTEPCKAC